MRKFGGNGRQGFRIEKVKNIGKRGIEMRIGLDVGSTTLKCVVLDNNDQIVYKDYRRHFSQITSK